MAALRLVNSIVVTSDINDERFDGVLVVADGVKSLSSPLKEALASYAEVDASGQCAVISCPGVAGNRLVFSPTGKITGDLDDVRLYQEAAEKGVKRAVLAGCKAPLLVRAGGDIFPLVQRCTFLGALHGLYVPLEVREARPEKAQKVAQLGMFASSKGEAEQLLQTLQAIESGRIVCRDIGGSDPERMAPPRVAEYVQQMFKDTVINVEVLSDDAVFQKEYPLLAAVNRCARHVERHRARLINLIYVGEGPVEETLLLVGKGITYDTGGADVKAGGIMAGMHRDKCGAAFVAGFFQTLAVHKPKGLKVLGAMCMVRNSIGSDCYVADELITSRAGVRVRVGNTDAEGRMVMCDVLAHMKERATSEVNPRLYTIATLTGHVIRAYGPNYTAAVDNGPAWTAGTSKDLVEVGDLTGDPFEISRLRRDDFTFNAPKAEYEDVVQANNLPSTMTNRGHIVPVSFMITASGLDKHGNDSAKPLAYTHLDIAGSSGPFPGIPTGSPIVSLAQKYVLNRQSGL